MISQWQESGNSSNSRSDQESSGATAAKQFVRVSMLVVSVLMVSLLCFTIGIPRKNDLPFWQNVRNKVFHQQSHNADAVDKPVKASAADNPSLARDHRYLLRKHLHHHQQQRQLKRLQRDYVDCSQYEHTMGLTDNLRINWVLNANFNDEDEAGTLSIEMIYQGQAWLGFAHSESASMIDSVAVIGVAGAPVSHQVQKYHLGSQSVDSIEPMQATQQTLQWTAFEQDENQTVMRFTKYLSEFNELTIHPNMQNTFLFAVGSSNELGYHSSRGVVVLDLEPCNHTAPIVQIGRDRIDNTVNVDEATQDRYMDSNSYVISIPVGDSRPLFVDDSNVIPLGSESETIDIAKQTEEGDEVVDGETLVPSIASDTDITSLTKNRPKSQIWWTIHGVFATITCGILLPVVIASSMLRGCFGGRVQGQDQISNNSLYRWSNVMVVVAVTVTFATAFVGAQIDVSSGNYQKSSGTGHSTDSGYSNHSLTYKTNGSSFSYHSPFGLALFIALLFFALTGTLRSYVCAILKSKGFQEVTDNDKRSGPSDFNSNEIKSVDKESGFANFVRRAWDRSHLFIGFVLLFITCWESKTGLDLYRDRFEDAWFGATVFWGISGPIIGVIGFLCVLQMCYQMLQWCYNAAYW